MEWIAGAGREMTFVPVVTLFSIAIIAIVLMRYARHPAPGARQCDLCGANNPKVANFCRQCGSRM